MGHRRKWAAKDAHPAASAQAAPAAVNWAWAAAQPGQWRGIHQPPAPPLRQRGLPPARPHQQRRQRTAGQAAHVAPA